MSELIYKDAPVAFAIKQRNEDDDDDKPKKFDNSAVVEGYITTYGNEDVVGDVIQQGSLDTFIKQFDAGETQLRMLFQHNRSNIIGEWTKLSSDDYGVYGTGEILQDVTLGADVATLVRRGLLNSFSIGFMASPDGYEMRADGGRLFTDISLVETSVVDVPANPQAQISSIKRDDGSFDMGKLEKLLRDAGCSRTEAKTAVSVINTGLRDADVVKQEETFYSNLLTILK